MKNMIRFGLVAALGFPLVAGYAQTPGAPVPGTPEQPQAAVPANLSPGAAEVIRLATSGVGDEVVLAYIQNSQAPFNLSADNVLYLKDLGLSAQVTSAMLSHDSKLRGQPQQYAPVATVPAPAPAPAPVVTAPVAPPPASVPPPAPAAAPVYVSSPPADVTYFYNDLAPYGTWVSLEGYGWCWQPRAVVLAPGWRPYCDGGYWVYTDAGWYWQSTYSWGWAPFHYGRWCLHPHSGWVWIPDRVWGPAWVTWRTAGDCCGWAPLPPHAEFDVRLGWRFNGVSVGVNFDFGLGVSAFAFVSFGDFCSHDLHHTCLPPARVTTVYKQTTIVNNYVVVNNTVVHRGIPIERVSAASRVAVPRATVRDWTGGRGGMPTRGGAVVYRAQPRAPARPANMVAQKVDARQPVIQHAPVVASRSERPSGFSGGASPASAGSRRAVMETPKASTWSGGAKPGASLQSQPASRVSEPTHAAPATATSTWSSEPRRASGSSAPASRSETASTSGNKSRGAGEAAASDRQVSASKGSSHVYYPKGYYQASEIGSHSSSEADRGGSAHTSESGPDSRSKRN
jgi:hypothetical protein